ncbi:hypothetical protein CCACVL1_13333 [Corchorus capsularis]|uniref:Uncharacterized protein n=1 Tax=Corchorus capsularis TaxID=210143 RepID=A0A1R3IBC5_COCAP|nr:hypothetical protein CCACVL1_13333 [Corchorus capsularis]
MLVANNAGISDERFMHLPRLESPTTLPSLPPFDDQERSFKSCYQSIDDMLTDEYNNSMNQEGCGGGGGVTGSAPPNNNNNNESKNDWVTLERLVASQLNGQVETSKQLSCFSDPNAVFSLCHDDDDDMHQLSHINLHRSNQNSDHQVYMSNENDLWSLTKSSSPSSSDPLCHLSV